MGETFHAKSASNSYIVIFKSHVTDAIASSHYEWLWGLHREQKSRIDGLGFSTQHPIDRGLESSLVGLEDTYDIGGRFLGYTGSFSPTIIDQIRAHQDVRMEKFSTNSNEISFFRISRST
jgi:cerevisin